MLSLSFGGVYSNSGTPSALAYQKFIVSSYNEIDSFFSEGYKKTFNKNRKGYRIKTIVQGTSRGPYILQVFASLSGSVVGIRGREVAYGSNNSANYC